MTRRVVTTREAAAMLGVTPRVIYEWARDRRRRGRRRIHAVGMRGRERLWDVDELLDAERDTRARRGMLDSAR